MAEPLEGVIDGDSRGTRSSVTKLGYPCFSRDKQKAVVLVSALAATLDTALTAALAVALAAAALAAALAAATLSAALAAALAATLAAAARATAAADRHDPQFEAVDAETHAVMQSRINPSVREK